MNVMNEIRQISQSVEKKKKAQKAAAKRKARIEIGAIDGVIGWGGRRNPLSRSNRAYRSGAVIPMEMHGGQGVLTLNDAEVEEALKIDAMLNPNVIGFECQPLRISLPSANLKGPGRSHTFDVRIYLKDGRRFLVYVKAASALKSRSAAPILAEIVAHTPADQCDRIVVISDVTYSRNYKDNNRRIYMCHQMPDPDADDRIRAVIAEQQAPLRIKSLIEKSGLQNARAWQATLRMIGAGYVGAERDFVIDYPSPVWRVS